MVTELIVAILNVAAMPVFAQAQKPSAAIVTHADVRKVLEVIKGDKAKTQTYCDMVTLGHELAAADEKKADELNQRMSELEKKLGPEYAALMDGFPDIDLGSEVGQEMSSMFAALDELLGGSNGLAWDVITSTLGKSGQHTPAPIIHAVCALSQAVGGNLGQAAG